MPSKRLTGFTQNALFLFPRFSLENIRRSLALGLQTFFSPAKMKKSGLLAAYVAAASATAVSASSSVQISHQDGMAQRSQENSSSVSSSSTEKFAPRFDGLRFIETLVTAHR